MYDFFKDEFSSCLFSIISKPTAIDVDYYFYRMNELTTVLKEYVSKCNTATNESHNLS